MQFQRQYYMPCRKIGSPTIIPLHDHHHLARKPILVLLIFHTPINDLADHFTILFLPFRTGTPVHPGALSISYTARIRIHVLLEDVDEGFNVGLARFGAEDAVVWDSVWGYVCMEKGCFDTDAGVFL